MPVFRLIRAGARANIQDCPGGADGFVDLGSNPWIGSPLPGVTLPEYAVIYGARCVRLPHEF